jgi:hypothetical protein
MRRLPRLVVTGRYARPMPEPPVRYHSDEEDSERWAAFPFRPGDIVVSTRSKTGTTWVQMICALLIFQTPELPAQLGSLSPWLDHTIAPADEVIAMLEAQRHRRFIKTHTPLDGVPIDPRATYIVTARHPLDMIVSLIHQGDNIDRAAVLRLTGQPEPEPRRPRNRQPGRCASGCCAGSIVIAIRARTWTGCPASCGTYQMPGPGAASRTSH